MKKKLLVFVLFISAFFVNAATDPSWSIKIDGAINWQRVTPLGHILVSSSEGLTGIDPIEGKIIWSNSSLKGLNESAYEEIGKTEFVSLLTGTPENQVLNILNTLTGKIILNSIDAGIDRILSKDVLSESGIMLLVVTKSGSNAASLISININTGEKLWTNDELFKIEEVNIGQGGKLGNFMSAMATEMGNTMNARGLLTEPVELAPDKLLLVHPNFVYLINPINGDTYWKTPMQSATRASVDIRNLDENIIYIGTQTEQEMTSMSSSQSAEPTITYTYNLISLSVSDGKSNWPIAFSTSGMLNKIIFDDKGIIVCPMDNKPSVNLVDYETGEGLWGKKGKGNKIKGSLVSFSKIDQNYVITTAFDNAFTNADEEYYINVLDPGTGLLKFEKYEKLKGDLVYTELVEKGILYITSKEINILNLTSGENMLDAIEAAKPLDQTKYDPRKHSLPFAFKDDLLYVFSSKSEMLYQIDIHAATVKPISKEKIKFEGKETPYNIEIKADGIVLSSEQNILKIDFEGTVQYQSYFPAPREPALLRAMAAAEAMRAAYIGAVATVYSEAFNQVAVESDSELEKAIGEGLSEGYGELADAGFAYSKDALGYASARFKASTQVQDFIFMLTEYENRKFGIVQVSKENGKQIEMIDLNKDKEPVYEIDEIYKFIYYKVAPDEIICYKFN